MLSLILLSGDIQEILLKIPAQPGTYALQFTVAEQLSISVGRLGVIDFLPGCYLYLGSAWGTGGLRARLRHHLRGVARPHWHVDWLRQSAGITSILFSTDPERLECAWSQAALALPGAFLPAVGFGSSDCTSGCLSHLIGLPPSTPIAEIEERLSASLGAPTWRGNSESTG